MAIDTRLEPFSHKVASESEKVRQGSELGRLRELNATRNAKLSM